jgi:hypothetical protein
MEMFLDMVRRNEKEALKKFQDIKNIEYTRRHRNK